MAVSAGDGLTQQLLPGHWAASGALGTRHHYCMCWLPSTHGLNHAGVFMGESMLLQHQQREGLMMH